MHCHLCTYSICLVVPKDVAHENPYATSSHVLTSFIALVALTKQLHPLTFLIEWMWQHGMWEGHVLLIKYILWETLFKYRMDILCAIRHKCHELAWSIIHLRGYSSFYDKDVSDHYSSVILILPDKYYPWIVYNDHYDQIFCYRNHWFWWGCMIDENVCP